MIKRIIINMLIFSIIILNFNQAFAQQPTILSETAVLIDSETGTIIAEKNANKKMYPASTTKIMTAILAIEMGKLTDIITVDDDTPHEIEGSHVALEPGEILTLKDLLYALMLPSANDAALVIAKHYGKGADEFVAKMNDKAKELGANNTHFANPHGLHDDNHYTTAYDLALITKYAMQNETFREIVSTVKYEIQKTNKKSDSRPFANLNRLLHSKGNQIYVDGAYIDAGYEGTTGVKTGYTPEAGNTLVASVKRNGTELIAVTMKGVSLEMYQDAHNLFNYGFNEYSSTTLISKNTFIQNVEIKDGDNKEISVISENDLTVLTDKESINDIKSKVIINDIKLPLEKNSVVGRIEYYLNDKVLGSVNLITPMSVNSTINDSNENIILKLFKSVSIFMLILVLLISFIRVYNNIRIKINRKKRRRRYNN